MSYTPDLHRYDRMQYNRCGNSGIQLPAVSLGLWHNFGDTDMFQNGRRILRRAFDAGITHFDLANNYGTPPGSAERNFGRMLAGDFRNLRHEMVISTKAGYYMWPGPYGDNGSRKYLVSSLDQSLRRMGLEYVDIFYHHRPDPHTPLEETMQALDRVVRDGKALYAGISNYPADLAERAIRILNELGTPCLIHQAKYSMFERWVEGGLLDVLDNRGVGCIAFSPLAQGLLTDKYLQGIPDGSRASRSDGLLRPEEVTDELTGKVRELNELANQRGQSLAQMAIAWLLKDSRVTSVLIGASSITQLEQNLEALNHDGFTSDELDQINRILQ